MFGVANSGALFGVMFLSHQVGSFLGAWLGGLSYDLSGSYAIAWSSMIAVGLVASLLQISADDRPRIVAA
jgi:predicted MFS family arabinose efflux permease